MAAQVGREQVGDASKVDVSGDGKFRAICMQDNEILVDTSRAGEAISCSPADK